MSTTHSSSTMMMGAMHADQCENQDVYDVFIEDRVVLGKEECEIHREEHDSSREASPFDVSVEEQGETNKK